MKNQLKNIEYSVPLNFSGLVEYQPGQIVSKTLSQDARHSLTLFAFEAGEEISTHESDGDALVHALDGEGKVTIDGREHTLHAGECIVMPARIPHAVYAEKRFKMLLTVLFPENRGEEERI